MATNIPEQWTKRAWYDVDTARAMLDSRRFFYVPFCCQQAVEKMIKAIIAKTTGETPPRIHNLIELAKRAGLTPDADQARLMRELCEYYIQSRYPEEVESMSSAAWKPVAEDVIVRTEKMVQWLSSIL